MSKENKTYFIVGIGRFGLSLCKRLVSLGQKVVAVDNDPTKVAEIADLVDYAAHLDASDEEALIKAGAKEADVAVVTIGENIEASIMATAILKGLDIDKVVSRAQTSIHARVLARVGAHRVIFPERDMGIKVAEQFVNPWLSNFSQIPGSGYLVGELDPLEEMIGKSLVDLDFRKSFGATLLLLERSGKKIFPERDTEIFSGDRLVVVGDTEKLAGWINEVKDKDKSGG